jgi:hypothetical protein
LTLDATGAWGFYAGNGANSGNTAETSTALASGKATLLAGSWHNLKLVFSGTSIKGLIDATQVFSITDGTYASGSVGLGTQSNGGTYTTAYFDNLIINTVGGALPAPTVFPQDSQNPSDGGAPPVDAGSSRPDAGIVDSGSSVDGSGASTDSGSIPSDGGASADGAGTASESGSTTFDGGASDSAGTLSDSGSTSFDGGASDGADLSDSGSLTTADGSVSSRDASSTDDGSSVSDASSALPSSSGGGCSCQMLHDSKPGASTSGILLIAAIGLGCTRRNTKRTVRRRGFVNRQRPAASHGISRDG